jgi:DNA-directed RNA polymerase specialized sigma24 family protein
MMDDAELLRSYAETRSETAFAGFVERRVGFVYASALRQVGGDAHAAQDVTQAVFVLAAKKAGRLAGHACLGGWLHTATCNVAHGVLREAWRRRARANRRLCA